MISSSSPFELVQALSNLGRVELLKRLGLRGFPDIGMPDVKLLWCLGPEPISVQRASVMMGTTKQFAARTVAKLRERGLVAVREDEADKRSLALSATESGAKLVALVSKERDAIEAEWEAQVGKAKLQDLTRCINALLTSS